MNKAVLVTIIIPTYNGLEFLGDCLFSLSQQTMKNCEVIVVDNNSADGSIDYLKKNYPQVKCIKLSKNMGFAIAVNRGIKRAKGNYLFSLEKNLKVHLEKILVR